MNPHVIKRSVVISGRKTSVSLEDDFWNGLKSIALSRQTRLSDLVTSIDVERQHSNLSSCLRLFVLDHYIGRLRARGAAPLVTAVPLAKSA